MEPPTTAAPQLEVWIDGSCPVCRRSQRWCSARDDAERLRFRDLHDREHGDPPASLEAMDETLHVRRADGSVRTGFDAWIEILAVLEGWHWLASFGRLPGIRQLGSAIYRLVARNRHRLSIG